MKVNNRPYEAPMLGDTMRAKMLANKTAKLKASGQQVSSNAKTNFMYGRYLKEVPNSKVNMYV